MFVPFDLIRARLRAPLRLIAAVLLAWALGEAVLYRSGAYFLIAQPESNAGAVVNALLILQRHYQPGVRTVLVLGDSRVAEGFSGPLASAGSKLHFISLAVPGSTPRTWYYLLREIERRGYRFDAVLLGMVYRPIGSKLADWPLAPNQDAALLGWRDGPSYAQSFTTPAMQDRAHRAVWFPAVTMGPDTQDLLRAPLQRARQVYKVRPLYLDYVPDYPGRDEQMPALDFHADGQARNWDAATPEQRALIEAHRAESQHRIAAEVLSANADYLRHWIGEIATLSARQQAPLILFPLPRSPYPALWTNETRVFESVQAVPGVRMLQADTLQDLEAPAYFFDTMHINRAGRERLSARLGALVRDELGGGAP